LALLLRTGPQCAAALDEVEVWRWSDPAPIADAMGPQE
jgi:hypothetical protein